MADAAAISPEGGGGKLPQNIVYFARLLRDAGLPIGPGQVIAALEAATDWNPKTIQTLIRRLHKKGALEVTGKNGREFIYRPTVAESESGHAASRSFLGRVFDGKLAPFLANFVENEPVSGEEIAELRRLLDKAEAQTRRQEP